MLLIASYIFYGFWDWRFLSLIWLSTLVDYICGLALDREKETTKRKIILAISILTNLSILGFFKYFNFFTANLQGLAGTFGYSFDFVTLNIILPVGISFYTFQSMSYTIDIYRKEMSPTHNFLDFALYVAFFPQLVAGPIERAKRLLPQIQNKRNITLNNLREGGWLILWGLFKKVFIADNLAKIVDDVFLQTGGFSGGVALMAIYAFAFQIYGDFSGYSDMARGLSKLMGIEIMVNFKFPYFVTNPRDFWKNWHISLSTWLRDYLYIPLGGNRKGSLMLHRNLLLTMLLGGLWHGAAWTFILWGFFHGVILSIHRIIEPYLKKIAFSNAVAQHIWFTFKVIFMFHVTCLGWLIFRADSTEQILNMLNNILFNFNFNIPTVKYYAIQIVFYTALLNLLQIVKRIKNDMYAVLNLHYLVRWPIYIGIYFLIMLLGEFGVKQFIYFQF